MSTIRKTITLTEQQDQWIKSRIEDGEFTNDSEYVRNLVRNDQRSRAKFISLRNKLLEGLDSGVSTKNIPNIMKDVEQSMKNNGEL